MQPKNINVELVAATRPNVYTEQPLGLATFTIDYPLFLHTELLTHRRFSRNASSARAQSTKRYTDMGYYLPDTWYEQGAGMQSGTIVTEPSTIENAINCYRELFTDASFLATNMLESGISKEQANRVLPQIKMVRAIVTGTEDAWKAFLALRNNANADKAMQKLAQTIQNELSAANWEYANDHTPFFNDGDTVESAIARIARVSYNREKGKNDKELHDRLLKDGHYSVFEHMACWQYNPLMSNLTCKRGDVFVVQETNDPYLSERWYKQDYEGWRSYRSALEV